jgi:excisionase family DNA binding protein
MEQNTEIAKLYKIDEVMEILSLSRSMINRLTADKSLGFVKIGKSLRFTNAQINDFVQTLEQS